MLHGVVVLQHVLVKVHVAEFHDSRARDDARFELVVVFSPVLVLLAMRVLRDEIAGGCLHDRTVIQIKP